MSTPVQPQSNECTTEERNSLFNYNNVFFSLFYDNERYCHNRCPEFGLSYVRSGEMVLDDGTAPIRVRKGECVFVPRDVSLSMYKQPVGDERYEGIFLTFTRPFLRQMSEILGVAKMREKISRLDPGAFKLQVTPELESLFKSMEPYFNPDVKPSDDIMSLKLQEALLAVLHIDRRFYPTLFDFSAPWKIDILDFLNGHFMYDMTISEMAHYTGRSLSSFKRDFAAVSDLTPEKWVVNRRLDESKALIEAGNTSMTDVCAKVGFKNTSHFSTVFKRRFGVSPAGYASFRSCPLRK